MKRRIFTKCPSWYTRQRDVNKPNVVRKGRYRTTIFSDQRKDRELKTNERLEDVVKRKELKGERTPEIWTDSLRGSSVQRGRRGRGRVENQVLTGGRICVLGQRNPLPEKDGRGSGESSKRYTTRHQVINLDSESTYLWTRIEVTIVNSWPTILV